jgi:DNA processing protein
MLDQTTRSSIAELTLSARVTRASQENDTWASPAPPNLFDSPTGHQLVSLGDAKYPRALQSIEASPPHLYLLGRTNQPGDDQAIAIVGSRTATDQGLVTARRIAGALAERGHTIVSGLAAGIDTAAHRGTLDADGRTIAVIGTGIDCVYPASNRKLRDQIAATGAVVSQFAAGHAASKTTFPARNVLIAGLSKASLLVELNERSGTRIEANITIEQGKPVLLWAPLLAQAEWAQRFARLGLVSFVDNIDDIANVLSPADGH